MARHQQWLEVAYRYDNLGFMPIPLQGGSKAKDPLTWEVARACDFRRGELVKLYQSGWGASPFCWERFHEMFDLAGGIGIAVGPCSGGLAVLDFDNDEAHRIWLASHRAIARALPKVKTVRGVHCYTRPRCRLSDGYVHFFVEGCEATAGELKFANGYVATPPTLHPDGVAYEWIGKCPTTSQLPVIEIEELGIEPLATGSGADFPEADHEELPEQRMTGNLTLSGGNAETTQRNDCWNVAIRLLLRCVPRQLGQRHFGLMTLVRSLKSVPELRIRPVEHFVRLIQVWCEELQRLPFVGRKDFQQNWREFRSLWNGCKKSSADQFHQMLAATNLTGLATRDKVRAICGCLSQKNGGKTFQLGSKSLARCIGVSANQARRILDRLTSDREIIRVSTGKHGNLTANRHRLGPEFYNGQLGQSGSLA